MCSKILLHGALKFVVLVGTCHMMSSNFLTRYVFIVSVLRAVIKNEFVQSNVFGYVRSTTWKSRLYQWTLTRLETAVWYLVSLSQFHSLFLHLPHKHFHILTPRLFNDTANGTWDLCLPAYLLFHYYLCVCSSTVLAEVGRHRCELNGP